MKTTMTIPRTFSRAGSSREQNRRVRTRGRAFTHKCVRDEEVHHSLTRCGPLQRGACVMRHPRHLSPPFYSSLPAGRTGRIPPTTLIRTRRPSSTIPTRVGAPIRPAASVRRGNPRANTPAAQLLVLPMQTSSLFAHGRAYGNRTSGYRTSIPREFTYAREEKLLLFAPCEFVTRLVETLVTRKDGD